MDAMIIYYSRAGKTEKVAQRIKNDLQCDILKVEPEKPYGNYFSALIRVIKERAKNIAPKFKTEVPNLSNYNTVFIGYPVWASDLPSFLTAFLTECNLKGKKIIPFATFGGSGINCTMGTLQKVCDGADIALPFEYGMSKKDNYEDWIRSVRELSE